MHGSGIAGVNVENLRVPLAWFCSGIRIVARIIGSTWSFDNEHRASSGRLRVRYARVRSGLSKIRTYLIAGRAEMCGKSECGVPERQ